MIGKSWTGRIVVIVFAAISLHLADPAFASDEDAAARAEERADLLSALKSAPNETVANAAVAAIWELWQTAPDAKAQALLDAARRNIRVSDFTEAMSNLDALVDYAPDYAEGWNARATTLFLQGEYDRSLDDIEQTLKLEPAHFGALSGKQAILMRQGRVRLAQKALRQAVEINPYLQERGMLVETPE